MLGKYRNNPTLFALDRLAFYECYKCKNPYFGGMRKCEEAGMQQDEKVRIYCVFFIVHLSSV